MICLQSSVAGQLNVSDKKKNNLKHSIVAATSQVVVTGAEM